MKPDTPPRGLEAELAAALAKIDTCTREIDSARESGLVMEGQIRVARETIEGQERELLAAHTAAEDMEEQIRRSQAAQTEPSEDLERTRLTPCNPCSSSSTRSVMDSSISSGDAPG